MTTRAHLWMIILAVSVMAFFVVRLCVGVELGWPQSSDGTLNSSILTLRLTSAITAIIVGVSLAISGVFLQTLLRNPLASPYILGLAAGAGLGIALAHLAARQWFNQEVPWWLEDLAATAGACATLGIVYLLGRRRGMVDPLSLLLVGVMVSAICGALIMLVQFLSPARDTDRLIRWMMGTISQGTSLMTLTVIGAMTLAGLTIGLTMARSLDAATLGDDEARSVGVPLDSLRWRLFAWSGILTAAAVFLAGPIGFVGLIAPHVARLLLGPRHAGLLIGSSLVGAGLLLAADTGAQLARYALHTPGLLPIGIVTIGIGGPMFIWLLWRGRSFDG